MKAELAEPIEAAPRQGRRLPAACPTVSVIVPVRNEREFVGLALTDLSAQDYDCLEEILVVDGESSDGTRQMVEDFAAKDRRIRLLNNEKRRVSTALNIGIRESVGDVIVRADCHARYAPDYVRQCVNCLRETGASNVGGPAIPLANGGLMHRAIVAAHLSRFGIGVARFRRTSYEGPADTVWPGAFLRSAITEVGAFRECLDRTEDIEFNARLRRAGHKIYVSRDIRVWYVPRRTLPALCAQSFANGRGVAEMLFLDRSAVRLRHLAPLAFVSALAAAGLMAVLAPAGRTVLLALLSCYALPLTVACVCACRQARRAALLLPVVLIALHMSYGLGSLLGVSRTLGKGVLRRWKRC